MLVVLVVLGNTGNSNSMYWIHRESAVINNSLNSITYMSTMSTQLCTAFNCPMFKVTERSTILGEYSFIPDKTR